MNNRGQQTITYVAAATTPTAVAAAMIPVRNILSNALAALLLVLLVLVAAIHGGRGPAITATLAGTLAFNLFHTTPYYRLTIDNLDDVEIAAAFLLIGLLAGEITHQATRDRRLAVEDSYEIARLYRISHLVNTRVALDEVRAAVETELRDILQLRDITFERQPGPPVGTRLAHTARIITDNDPGADQLRLPAQAVALPVPVPNGPDARFIFQTHRPHRVHRDQLVTAVTLANMLGERLATK